MTTVRTIIVGAGQAGLAVAAALVERGMTPERDFLILDQSTPDRLAWRTRWDSLRLFTPAWYSQLRGLGHEGDRNRRLSATEIADYLDRYRHRLGLDAHWSTLVNSVIEDDHGHTYVVSTNAGDLHARNVVIATGPHSSPYLPAWSENLAPETHLLHSGEYRRPSQIGRGPVLVVGGGNSGVQIARELATTHIVTLSIGTQLPAVPESVWGADLFSLLRISGLLHAQVPPKLAARLSRREPIIGPGINDLKNRGVDVRSRVVAAHGGRVRFADGSDLVPSSLVLATGFRPGFELAGGSLVSRRGRTTRSGVFTVGAPWQSARGSALIGGVSRDAAKVADQIMRRP